MRADRVKMNFNTHNKTWFLADRYVYQNPHVS